MMVDKWSEGKISPALSRICPQEQDLNFANITSHTGIL